MLRFSTHSTWQMLVMLSAYSLNRSGAASNAAAAWEGAKLSRFASNRRDILDLISAMASSATGSRSKASQDTNWRRSSAFFKRQLRASSTSAGDTDLLSISGVVN